jgi:hypothetical protein
MPASKILLNIKTDTKEEETEILTELLTRLQYSPAFVTSFERPDFEIELNGNLIGVEITKFYSDYTKKGSRTQQKISEWEKFAEQLKVRLSELNPEYDYLYASVHFHNRKVDYKELLTANYFNESTEVIKSAHLSRSEQKTISVTYDKFPFLSARIDSIFLWDK